MSGPLLLKAQALTKRWGQSALLQELGYAGELQEDTGEIWLVSDLKGFESPVQGHHSAQTLAEIMATDARWLMGPDWPEDETEFPLIVKLLMAGSRLSVQVHPDAEGAKALRGVNRGKHEAWWVLAAEPRARIYRGMKADTTAEQARRAIKEQRFQDLLNEFVPAANDFVNIPPGTFHGCGDGLVLLEVQERCNLTFRVYDWGRENTELHIDEAMHVGRLERDESRPVPLSGASKELAEAPFTMDCMVLEAGQVVPAGDRQRAEIWVIAEGRVRLEGAGFEQELGAGETVIWPAALAAGRLRILQPTRCVRSVYVRKNFR